MRYRVFINLHKYGDCSDPARRGIAFISHDGDAQEAADACREWRDQNNAAALEGRKTYKYLGLIHNAEPSPIPGGRRGAPGGQQS